MKNLHTLLLFALVATVSQAQLINPNFEVWDTDSSTATTYASSWLEQNNNYCYQITTAQNGNYALGVSVWYYYVKNKAVQKTATTLRPVALQGYYTYTSNKVKTLSGDTINDTAMVHVLLTKYNSATLHSDTIGYGITNLFASANYSQFNCNVTYTSTATPDSITFIFDPSIVRRYENVTYYQAPTANGKCSFLTIDNLSLQTPLGIEKNAKELEISVAPNPVNEFLNISISEKFKVQSLKWVILDAFGSEVFIGNTDSLHFTLSTLHLKSGIYFLKLGNEIHKFIKE